VENLPPTPI